ncbi:hypothetical protein, partial [Herbiconiux daphne]
GTGDFGEALPDIVAKPTNNEGSIPTPKEVKAPEPKPRKETQYQMDQRNEKVVSAALKAFDPMTPRPVQRVADEMTKGLSEEQVSNLITYVGKAKRKLGRFENRNPGEGRYLETLGNRLQEIRKGLRKGK